MYVIYRLNNDHTFKCLKTIIIDITCIFYHHKTMIKYSMINTKVIKLYI